MGFFVYSVPSSHISYLKLHQGLVPLYAEGTKPDTPDAAPFPADWPSEPLHSIVDWSVNWKNVDLYHWILNGDSILVEGSGSIFQTWYEPDRHSAMKLDRHNETFAFDANQVQDLAALAAKVTVASVRAAFSAWCKAKGKDYEPDEPACEPFVEEFKQLARGLQEVMRRGDGLVWA